jgi:pyruvate formate lyase activating enzyme
MRDSVLAKDQGTGSAKAATGTVFNVQRFSTEEGPGIRTAVFMKGCPLRCHWCHNPEGLSPKPQLVWHEVRCIGARRCLAACPVDALELTPTGISIDRGRCSPCDLCVDACPSVALEVIGRRWTPEELLSEVIKDAEFHVTSAGGVTVTGGEPTMQPEFVEAFLRLCREAGIATALDTCGYADWSVYERLLPHADLVLYDLKLTDRERHHQATGVYPDRILANAAGVAERDVPMWVRTPVVPDYTDSEENIRALAHFIRERLPTVQRWDLLAYNNLGRPKYGSLQLPYALEDTELPARNQMERLAAIATDNGDVPVVWSGAVRD